MQESAAQWLHQAVPAYNTLLEHVSSLPHQSAAPGAPQLPSAGSASPCCCLVSCLRPPVWRTVRAHGCPQASSAPRMRAAGLGLPQILKCNWSRGSPTVAQIPFPEGDSFELRLADATQRSKYQQLQPRSKAALMQLFGDDFDLGEPPKPHCHHAMHSCTSLRFARQHPVRAGQWGVSELQVNVHDGSPCCGEPLYV